MYSQKYAHIYCYVKTHNYSNKVEGVNRQKQWYGHHWQMACTLAWPLPWIKNHWLSLLQSTQTCSSNAWRQGSIGRDAQVKVQETWITERLNNGNRLWKWGSGARPQEMLRSYMLWSVFWGLLRLLNFCACRQYIHTCKLLSSFSSFKKYIASELQSTVTPVQLMKPGIGGTTSCPVGDFGHVAKMKRT